MRIIQIIYINVQITPHDVKITPIFFKVQKFLYAQYVSENSLNYEKNTKFYRFTAFFCKNFT